MDDLEVLEKNLGYSFRDRDLFLTALTHSSYAKELVDGTAYNERLEFLGDAFFDAVVGEEFFRRFTDRKEGFLSRMRAQVVCENSLARRAKAIDLGNYLRLGRGEEKTGGRSRPSILADAMEAIIGAIYLDGGFDEVRRVVLDIFGEEIDSASRGELHNEDHKTKLQELLQARGIRDIRYESIDESGPDHDKIFTAGLYVNGELCSEGRGKSKKEAQQQAAGKLLEREAENAL